MAAPKELLKRVPLFKGLDDKHIDTLSRTFTDRTFSAGQEITSEGGGGVGFFIIEDGEAVVTVGGEERRTLGSGDYFGEIALIDEGPRSSTPASPRSSRSTIPSSSFAASSNVIRPSPRSCRRPRGPRARRRGPPGRPHALRRRHAGRSRSPARAWRWG